MEAKRRLTRVAMDGSRSGSVPDASSPSGHPRSPERGGGRGRVREGGPMAGRATDAGGAAAGGTGARRVCCERARADGASRGDAVGRRRGCAWHASSEQREAACDRAHRCCAGLARAGWHGPPRARRPRGRNARPCSSAARAGDGVSKHADDGGADQHDQHGTGRRIPCGRTPSDRCRQRHERAARSRGCPAEDPSEVRIRWSGDSSACVDSDGRSSGSACEEVGSVRPTELKAAASGCSSDEGSSKLAA